VEKPAKIARGLNNVLTKRDNPHRNRQCFGMKDLLHHFAVHTPTPIADTPIATVWQVHCADDTLAALKIYKNGDMQDEVAGFALLDAWNGHGAARLLGQSEGAVLIEWLDGPSLGDLVRDGQDDQATIILADVANRLHARPLSVQIALPSLTDTFMALTKATFTGDCPAETRHIITRAQRLASTLLHTQTDLRVLHRDLHHDNIMHSARGYLAFDAKGVIGERAYELANAFRNPIGAVAIYSDPFVIQRRLAMWSQAFDVQPTRLLQWAIAHSALSLAWTHGGIFPADTDVALIHTFYAVLD
jgi:streptomycin 6-kinase